MGILCLSAQLFLFDVFLREFLMKDQDFVKRSRIQWLPPNSKAYAMLRDSVANLKLQRNVALWTKTMFWVILEIVTASK